MQSSMTACLPFRVMTPGCLLCAALFLLPTMAASGQSNQYATDNTGWREAFDKDGYLFRSSMIMDFTQVLDGGLDDSASQFRHLVKAGITFDLEEMMGLNGSSFHVEMRTQNGTHASDVIGDLQGFSNIDAQSFTLLYELWYEKEIDARNLRLKFGQVDAGTEFNVAPHAGGFMHVGAGQNINILHFNAYPTPAYSGNMFWTPNAWFVLGTGVYDGSLNEGINTLEEGGLDSLFGSPDDLFSIIEATINWTVGYQRFPGAFKVGGWYFTGDFDRLDGSGNRDDTKGGYFIVDQVYKSDSPRDPAAAKRSGGFLRYSWAEEEVSEVSHHIACGLTWKGHLFNRRDDTFGVMASFAGLSDDTTLTGGDELALEAYYQYQPAPWFSLKPNFQYIRDVGGTAGIDDAFLLSLRLEMEF